MHKNISLSLFFVYSSLLVMGVSGQAMSNETPGETLFFELEQGNIAAVERFIKKDPLCVYWRDDLDNTLLHYAAVRCVQYGLRYGEGLVRTLLSAGANPNARNDCGLRPTDFIEIGTDGSIAIRYRASYFQTEPTRRYLSG